MQLSNTGANGCKPALAGPFKMRKKKSAPQQKTAKV
jgi:hypothetical protein